MGFEVGASLAVDAGVTPNKLGLAAEVAGGGPKPENGVDDERAADVVGGPKLKAGF